MERTIFVLNSKSQLKKEAIDEVLKEYFKKNYAIITKESVVNFPETPFNKQTFLGAKKRATILKNKILKKEQEVKIFIGLESGLILRFNKLFEECWCCLIYKKKYYFGYSSGFPLPKKILSKMKKTPHNEILKALEFKNKIYSKDTWGHYTNGILSRKMSLMEAFRNALLSFLLAT